MKKVIKVIVTEAESKLNQLKLGDSITVTQELLDLIVLHEQLAGKPIETVPDICIDCLVRRNLVRG